MREGFGTTLTRLLAIAGAGFVLATGHAFVRTAWFDRSPIVLARAVALASAGEALAPEPAVKPGSISLEQAFALFEEGAFFLDARYEADFRAGHIEGAFWMPASRVITPAGRGELQIIEPGGTVVIYCTGGDCDASENTAIRLEQAGFTFDIRILGKGYVDWVDAGLPIGTGMDGTDTGEGGTP